MLGRPEPAQPSSGPRAPSDPHGLRRPAAPAAAAAPSGNLLTVPRERRSPIKRFVAQNVTPLGPVAPARGPARRRGLSVVVPAGGGARPAAEPGSDPDTYGLVSDRSISALSSYSCETSPSPRRAAEPAPACLRQDSAVGVLQSKVVPQYPRQPHPAKALSARPGTPSPRERRDERLTHHPQTHQPPRTLPAPAQAEPAARPRAGSVASNLALPASRASDRTRPVSRNSDGAPRQPFPSYTSGDAVSVSSMTSIPGSAADLDRLEAPGSVHGLGNPLSDQTAASTDRMTATVPAGSVPARRASNAAACDNPGSSTTSSSRGVPSSPEQPSSSRPTPSTPAAPPPARLRARQTAGAGPLALALPGRAPQRFGGAAPQSPPPAENRFAFRPSAEHAAFRAAELAFERGAGGCSPAHPPFRSAQGLMADSVTATADRFAYDLSPCKAVPLPPQVLPTELSPSARPRGLDYPGRDRDTSPVRKRTASPARARVGRPPLCWADDPPQGARDPVVSPAAPARVQGAAPPARLGPADSRRWGDEPHASSSPPPPPPGLDRRPPRSRLVSPPAVPDGTPLALHDGARRQFHLLAPAASSPPGRRRAAGSLIAPPITSLAIPPAFELGLPGELSPLHQIAEDLADQKHEREELQEDVEAIKAWREATGTPQRLELCREKGKASEFVGSPGDLAHWTALLRNQERKQAELERELRKLACGGAGRGGEDPIADSTTRLQAKLERGRRKQQKIRECVLLAVEEASFGPSSPAARAEVHAVAACDFAAASASDEPKTPKTPRTPHSTPIDPFVHGAYPTAPQHQPLPLHPREGDLVLASSIHERQAAPEHETRIHAGGDCHHSVGSSSMSHTLPPPAAGAARKRPSLPQAPDGTRPSFAAPAEHTGFSRGSDPNPHPARGAPAAAGQPAGPRGRSTSYPTQAAGLPAQPAPRRDGSRGGAGRGDRLEWRLTRGSYSPPAASPDRHFGARRPGAVLYVGSEPPARDFDRSVSPHRMALSPLPVNCRPVYVAKPGIVSPLRNRRATDANVWAEHADMVDRKAREIVRRTQVAAVAALVRRVGFHQRLRHYATWRRWAALKVKEHHEQADFWDDAESDEGGIATLSPDSIRDGRHPAWLADGEEDTPRPTRSASTQTLTDGPSTPPIEATIPQHPMSHKSRLKFRLHAEVTHLVVMIAGAIASVASLDSLNAYLVNKVWCIQKGGGALVNDFELAIPEHPFPGSSVAVDRIDSVDDNSAGSRLGVEVKEPRGFGQSLRTATSQSLEDGEVGSGSLPMTPASIEGSEGQRAKTSLEQGAAEHGVSSRESSGTLGAGRAESKSSFLTPHEGGGGSERRLAARGTRKQKTLATKDPSTDMLPRSSSYKESEEGSPMSPPREELQLSIAQSEASTKSAKRLVESIGRDAKSFGMRSTDVVPLNLNESTESETFSKSAPVPLTQGTDYEDVVSFGVPHAATPKAEPSKLLPSKPRRKLSKMLGDHSHPPDEVLSRTSVSSFGDPDALMSPTRAPGESLTFGGEPDDARTPVGIRYTDSIEFVITDFDNAKGAATPPLSALSSPAHKPGDGASLAPLSPRLSRSGRRGTGLAGYELPPALVPKGGKSGGADGGGSSEEREFELTAGDALDLDPRDRGGPPPPPRKQVQLSSPMTRKRTLHPSAVGSDTRAFSAHPRFAYGGGARDTSPVRIRGELSRMSPPKRILGQASYAEVKNLSPHRLSGGQRVVGTAHTSPPRVCAAAPFFPGDDTLGGLLPPRSPPGLAGAGAEAAPLTPIEASLSHTLRQISSLQEQQQFRASSTRDPPLEPSARPADDPNTPINVHTLSYSEPNGVPETPAKIERELEREAIHAAAVQGAHDARRDAEVSFELHRLREENDALRHRQAADRHVAADRVIHAETTARQHMELRLYLEGAHPNQRRVVSPVSLHRPPPLLPGRPPAGVDVLVHPVHDSDRSSSPHRDTPALLIPLTNPKHFRTERSFLRRDDAWVPDAYAFSSFTGFRP